MFKVHIMCIYWKYRFSIRASFTGLIVDADAKSVQSVDAQQSPSFNFKYINKVTDEYTIVLPLLVK